MNTATKQNLSDVNRILKRRCLKRKIVKKNKFILEILLIHL